MPFARASPHRTRHLRLSFRLAPLFPFNPEYLEHAENGANGGGEPHADRYAPAQGFRQRGHRHGGGAACHSGRGVGSTRTESATKSPAAPRHQAVTESPTAI